LYSKGFATVGIASFEAIDEIQGQIFDPHGDPIWVPSERAWTPLDGMSITPKSAVADGSKHVCSQLDELRPADPLDGTSSSSRILEATRSRRCWWQSKKRSSCGATRSGRCPSGWSPPFSHPGNEALSADRKEVWPAFR
jgi:hypothetical protein